MQRIGTLYTLYAENTAALTGVKPEQNKTEVLNAVIAWTSVFAWCPRIECNRTFVRIVVKIVFYVSGFTI